MPDAVREAMEWVIETQGAMSTLNAQQYVKQMEKSRRFQIEAWAWRMQEMMTKHFRKLVRR